MSDDVRRDIDDASTPRDLTRAAQRAAIEAAALSLLDAGGPGAVTSRAVSALADVQPMTIFRAFGDMDGVLAAAANRGFRNYVQSKKDRPRAADPVDDLRDGWDLHVEFGLAHPHVYAYTYGRYRDGTSNAAVDAAAAILDELVARAAQAGRITKDVTTAAKIIHAAGCGVVMTLMQVPVNQREMTVSLISREAILAAVTTDATASLEGPSSYAVALATLLPAHDTKFSDAELNLLKEWLRRLSTIE